MFFRTHLTPDRKDAIIKYKKIIDELNYARTEWKKFKPEHVQVSPSIVPLQYVPKTPPIIEHHQNKIKEYHHELEYLMKYAKASCIKLCHKYISLLNLSCEILKKYDVIHARNRLNKIHSRLVDLYNDFLLSTWNQDLARIHGLEFKADLEIKKFRKYIGLLATQRDIKIMQNYGISFADSFPYLNKQFAEKMLKRFERLADSEYWKNWRMHSLFKNTSRKILNFTNMMKDIITEYKVGSDNLT